MPKLRAVIVDDEPLAAEGMKTLLARDPEIEVAAICQDGFMAIERVQDMRPDLLFLDVQMPELDGFQVLQQIGDEIPAVIFVTAYDRYALRAFEVHALDYLLKPFSDDRFADAVARAKRIIYENRLQWFRGKVRPLIDSDRDPLPAHGARYLRRLVVKNSGRIVFLKVEEIDWVEAMDYYVALHVGKRTHLLRRTMNELEQCLDPNRFARIHRSAIVNLERVRELYPATNGEYEVLLHDGTELRLSRSRKHKIPALFTAQL